MSSDVKIKIISSLKEALAMKSSQIICEKTDKYGKEILSALGCARNMITSNFKYSEKEKECVNCIIDRIWERLNIGKWQNIPLYVRDLYSYSCYLKIIVLFKFTLEDVDSNIGKNLTKILKTVDFGLLLGSSFRRELCQIAKTLCFLINSVSDNQKLVPHLFSDVKINFGRTSGKQVICAHCPSIETFLTNYFNPHIPAKIKGYINHWPAVRKWQDINYILEKIGSRTVPVEIGSSYTSSNWSQKLMTVRFFVENCILQSKYNQTGYLAQHQLFNQIPELLQDIKEPEYCSLSENYPDADTSDSCVDVNFWFGPSNTVSPLHYDPKHNLLAQVVGTKRILLIGPKWNDHVYPFEDNLLFNTAQVDPENPDHIKFPKYKDADVLECILEPGDMLYIPPKWWHHVRSCSPSISISFWFGNN